MAAAPRIVHIENPASPSLSRLVAMLEAGQKRSKPERAEDKADRAKRGKTPIKLRDRQGNDTPLAPSPRSPKDGSKDPRFFDPKKDNELAGLGPNKPDREKRPNREKAMRDRKREAQKDQGTLYPELPKAPKGGTGPDKGKGDEKKADSKPVTPRKPVLKLATKKPEPNSNDERTQFEQDRQDWARNHPDNRGPKAPTYTPPKATSKPIPPNPDTPKIPPTRKPILIVTTKKIPTKPPEDILVPKPGLSGGLRTVMAKKRTLKGR